MAHLRALHLEVDLPRLPRLAVHHEAAREPHLEDVVLCQLLCGRPRLQREQRRLGLLVLAGGGAGDRVVVQEGGVVGEVGLDRREVDEDVVELCEHAREEGSSTTSDKRQARRPGEGEGEGSPGLETRAECIAYGGG